MPSVYSGGCACGAIRYACTAEPLFSFNCHCRACQRASGASSAAILLVPETAFTLTTGTPRYHQGTADSGKAIKRGFCPECGSPLVLSGHRASSFGFVGIMAASLDDPSWFHPTADFWTSTAQPWAVMNPRLAKCEQNFTEDQLKEALTSRE